MLPMKDEYVCGSAALITRNRGRAVIAQDRDGRSRFLHQCIGVKRKGALHINLCSPAHVCVGALIGSRHLMVVVVSSSLS